MKGTDIMEYINFKPDNFSPENFVESVMIQEANEESKKLRRDARQFIKDNYTSKDAKNMSAKQKNRVKKFMKDTDYDPKTGTIKTDMVDKNGKPVRVKFTTKGFPKHGFSADEPAGMLSTERTRNDTYNNIKKFGILDADTKNAVEDMIKLNKIEDTIHMNNKQIHRKPAIAQGMLKHEEGHLDKWRNTKADSNDRSHTGKVERSARKLINSSRLKGELHEHDLDPEEYYADLYSAKHNKYKNKTQVFGALSSNDALIRKKCKKQLLATGLASANPENIDELKDLLTESIEMVDEMIDIPEIAEKDKGFLRKQNSIYKDCLKKIEKLDYDDAMKTLKESDKKSADNALTALLQKLDAGAKLRKQFTQNMIKEYDVIPDDILDVIQEMFIAEYYVNDEDENAVIDYMI